MEDDPTLAEVLSRLRASATDVKDSTASVDSTPLLKELQKDSTLPASAEGQLGSVTGEPPAYVEPDTLFLSSSKLLPAPGIAETQEDTRIGESIAWANRLFSSSQTASCSPASAARQETSVIGESAASADHDSLFSSSQTASSSPASAEAQNGCLPSTAANAEPQPLSEAVQPSNSQGTEAEHPVPPKDNILALPAPEAEDKPFPLFALPRELRDQVYKEIFKTPGRSTSCCKLRHPSPRFGREVRSMLLVNRQTYNEGLPHLYRETKFDFEFVYILHCFVFRLDDYALSLFTDVRVQFSSLWAKAVFKRLATYGNLKNLSIRIDWLDVKRLRYQKPALRKDGLRGAQGVEELRTIRGLDRLEVTGWDQIVKTDADGHKRSEIVDVNHSNAVGPWLKEKMLLPRERRQLVRRPTSKNKRKAAEAGGDKSQTGASSGGKRPAKTCKTGV